MNGAVLTFHGAANLKFSDAVLKTGNAGICHLRIFWDGDQLCFVSGILEHVRVVGEVCEVFRVGAKNVYK